MARIRCLESKGTLFMDFRYRGVRIREYTALADTLSNRKRLQKALDKIDTEIALGTFDCRRRFNIDHLCRLNIDQGLKLAA